MFDSNVISTGSMKKRRRCAISGIDEMKRGAAWPMLKTFGMTVSLCACHVHVSTSQALGQLAFVSHVNQCRSNVHVPTRCGKVQRTPILRLGASNNYNRGYLEEHDEIQSHLNKISWLPSVRYGKQPFKAPSFSRMENIDGDSYASIDSTGSTTTSKGTDTPPGTKNIEVLPVLPLSMVTGLESMFSDYSSDSSYGSGVWQQQSSFLPGHDGVSNANTIFSSSAFLPHTKGHVLTVAEPRYKQLYDDLLRLGSYWGEKREGLIRSAKELGEEFVTDSQLPDPDEKRRFIVTVSNPNEPGVFAEYGVLFQLRDLDEVAAVGSYNDELSEEELNELLDPKEFGYSEDLGKDFMDVLLDTHYEATHDVIGRVKIHRFVNPECWQDGPDGEDYLMAEATVFDLIDDSVTNNTNKKVQTAKKETVVDLSSTMAVAKKLEEQVKQQAFTDVADAVSRIREELRSAVDEAFMKQQQTTATKSKSPSSNTNDSVPPTKPKQIPLVPKGIVAERRPDGALLKEEKAVRESFAKLVSLQQELKEKFRFTPQSVQSFGIGTVGLWLSAAAWSKFVDKRLEASNAEMQADLQNKLAVFIDQHESVTERVKTLTEEDGDEDEDSDDDDEPETVDFDELSPELQHEFLSVQARATEELGPVAFERTVMMQCIVQAESYVERLNLLRECVDNERRRLEARKLLQSVFGDGNLDDAMNNRGHAGLSRKDADVSNHDESQFFQEDVFQ